MWRAPRASAVGSCQSAERLVFGLLAARQVPELIARPVLSCNSDSPVFSADYALFGRAIRLRLYGADIALDLTPRVEPLRTSPGDPDTVIDVFDDGVAFQVMVDGCSVASEDTLYGARVVVLQQFLKASRPEKWLAVLHAGACGSGPRCIVFPACSHSGKSTLAAALLHQGLTFYGDDSIPLERGSLKIQPMPFALMIREGSWAALSAMFPDLLEADTLDRWGEKVRFLNPPAPAQRFDSMAAAIVFTQYIAGNKIDLQRLQTFDALLRLEASGLWVDHDPEGIGDFLRWFESLPSYSLTYSDLAEAGEVLRSLLAA